jgi:SMODS and SLOG-associating 2TM effector domain family 4
MTSERQVAEEWYDRVALTQHGHYVAALYFSRRQYWIGIPVVLLTAIVGTSVFASIQQKPDLWLQIAVGLMSIAATVLACLQTFLGYTDRAEKHRLAGARYGAVGRQLELMLARDSGWDVLDTMKQQLDTLAQESPNIPQAVHGAMEQYRPRWRRGDPQQQRG